MPGRIEGYGPMMAGVAMLPLWRTVLRDKLENGRDKTDESDAKTDNDEREPETNRPA